MLLRQQKFLRFEHQVEQSIYLHIKIFGGTLNLYIKQYDTVVD